MRYFVDCEFYEDGRTIDLISLGAVCSDGREFYAVSREARLDLVSDWVRENVLAKLPHVGSGAWMMRAEMAAAFADFVRPAPDQKRAEVWGYYADYDHVAICQLFGTMMNLPKHYPMYCLDLKQLAVMKGDPELPKQTTGEHDALCDAIWNMGVYDFLMGIP